MSEAWRSSRSLVKSYAQMASERQEESIAASAFSTPAGHSRNFGRGDTLRPMREAWSISHREDSVENDDISFDSGFYSPSPRPARSSGGGGRLTARRPPPPPPPAFCPSPPPHHVTIPVIQESSPSQLFKSTRTHGALTSRSPLESTMRLSGNHDGVTNSARPRKPVGFDENQRLRETFVINIKEQLGGQPQAHLKEPSNFRPETTGYTPLVDRLELARSAVHQDVFAAVEDEISGKVQARREATRTILRVARAWSKRREQLRLISSFRRWMDGHIVQTFWRRSQVRDRYMQVVTGACHLVAINRLRRSRRLHRRFAKWRIDTTSSAVQSEANYMVSKTAYNFYEQEKLMVERERLSGSHMIGLVLTGAQRRRLVQVLSRAWRMWADKTCYFRWRDEMLMVVLRRLVRNRSQSYGQQLLAMFQAAWRMWAEEASSARYLRVGLRMLSQVKASQDATNIRRRLYASVQVWYQFMRNDRSRERSLAMAAMWLRSILNRSYSGQMHQMVQRSWSTWRSASARFNALSTAAVLVRKICTTQEDLKAHERFLSFWNAWVQRTIFLRSHMDLANVKADNAVTRRFVSIRNVVRRYLFGRARVQAFHRWQQMSSAKTKLLRAAHSILRRFKRVHTVDTKRGAHDMWERWGTHVARCRRLEEAVTRMHRIALGRERVHGAIKPLHRSWSRWANRVVRRRCMERAATALRHFTVTAHGRWEVNKKVEFFRRWSKIASSLRRQCCRIDTVLRQRAHGNTLVAWANWRSHTKRILLQNAACKALYFSARWSQTDRLQRGWAAIVEVARQAHEIRQAASRRRRDQALCCQVLRHAWSLHKQRVVSSAWVLWVQSITEWRDEEFLYHTLLSRMMRRIWVVRQTAPRRRAWQRWVHYTAQHQQDEQAEQNATMSLRWRSDLEWRRRGGALHIARLVGLRSVVATTKKEKAFFYWHHYCTRQRYRNELAAFKIDGIYQTRRRAGLISAVKRWKWLLGTRERRMESLVWEPRRSSPNRAVSPSGASATSTVDVLNLPKPPKAVAAYTAYTHLMYGMTPETPPTKAYHHSRHHNIAPSVDENTAVQLPPNALSPNDEEIVLVTLRRPPPPPTDDPEESSIYENSTNYSAR